MKSLKENGLDVGVFSKIDSKNDFLNIAKKLDILMKIVFKPRISRGSRGV